ncbi:MAG: hypothetical protein KatS3mg087_0367 [Patescibacteria group bacterium]|nr:MAG: hypothetical protein KatS3mg087_0367 [Patescibacteria group bacterium]
MDPVETVPTTERPIDPNQRSKQLLGYILVALGGYFLLSNLRVFEISLWRIVITWWPLVLIHFGVEQIAKDRPLFRNLWHIALVAIIAYILISNFL